MLSVFEGCGNGPVLPYAQLMAERRPFITIRLDLSDPIEVYDFVDLFASVADQFERYLRSEYPDRPAEGRMFIQEVRSGSIIVDLFAGWQNLIQYMDDALIVTGFASLFSKRIRGYIFGQRNPGAGKADLNDYLGTVRAVSKDSDGKATIESAVFREGVLTKEAVFSFTSKEAAVAASNIQKQKDEMERLHPAEHQKVLMYFQRSDRSYAGLGKRSGERVIIEPITRKSLHLIYSSPMAEQRVKHEIRESDDNIFKKGFVVDVNVQTKGGKPAAYALTHVHDVIDLPDDDEGPTLPPA